MLCLFCRKSLLPELLEELLNFLDGSFPDGHEFKSLSALPKPERVATPWLLGTSERVRSLLQKWIAIYFWLFYE